MHAARAPSRRIAVVISDAANSALQVHVALRTASLERAAAGLFRMGWA